MARYFLICSFLVIVAHWSAHNLCAQSPKPSAPKTLGAWKLEELLLKDGKVYKGVVQDEREYDLDFAEIMQPAGKPMYGVLRWVNKREVLKLTKLPKEEHEELLQRFEQFRNRTVIEAGRMEELLLKQDEVGGKLHHLYDGPWFRVDSTTDEETTRRCVVRIEQIFRAYRMVLPPKGRPPEPLTVRLFGSLDEYRAELRRMKLNIKNPAFYSTRQRTILAGSDLNTYAEHLTEIRSHHEELRKTWQKFDVDFQRETARIIGDLKTAKFTTDEINAEIRLRKARWNEQLVAQFNTITEQDRRNDGKFAEVTAQMFAQLYHEAFHAWIDNFVYASSRQNVPRWLNEGLAQVFESGKLDGQSLRLDSPSAVQLAVLQEELRRRPQPLEDMLADENLPFLDGHVQDAQRADRNYAYAWGLAWYLTFHEQKLAGHALDRYVSEDSRQFTPVERFEKFTGKKLAPFETDWRRAMLELRVPK
ncbi:hypothetical protein ETAA8_24180 [Anatilimnocola aggregata]|uniref:DUF1570 domain-containing protein n=1 Tax=Anatilimnocola aggregata TaxID=2528021 RepID=A0A517YAV8_9BACT|nr:DUF1570 domain-containing protein [Anatilimnocola aggregata]QDU27331.1 hypothetical protein ETAA8_24180 [Anatilimnocola aggregata]